MNDGITAEPGTSMATGWTLVTDALPRLMRPVLAIVPEYSQLLPYIQIADDDAIICKALPASYWGGGKWALHESHPDGPVMFYRVVGWQYIPDEIESPFRITKKDYNSCMDCMNVVRADYLAKWAEELDDDRLKTNAALRNLGSCS